MFNALTAAKWAISGVVGIGAKKIVHGIITSNVPVPESPVDKVTITAASWVLSAIVTKASKNTTNEMIDDVVGSVTKIVHEFKESAALTRIQKGESSFTKEGLDVNDYELGENGKYKRASKKVEVTQPETPAAS